MLVAPILAILAWFGTDAMVADKPFKSEAGEAYRLAEKPNCRWESGECGLKNGDFELLFYRKTLPDGRLEWTLESSHQLAGIQFAVVNGGKESPAPSPSPMQQDDEQGMRWWLQTEKPEPGVDKLRLAAKADESLYYGEVGTTFLKGERKIRTR